MLHVPRDNLFPVFWFRNPDSSLPVQFNYTVFEVSGPQFYVSNLLPEHGYKINDFIIK